MEIFVAYLVRVEVQGYRFDGVSHCCNVTEGDATCNTHQRRCRHIAPSGTGHQVIRKRASNKDQTTVNVQHGQVNSGYRTDR